MKKPVRTDECASWNEPTFNPVRDTVIGSLIVAAISLVLAVLLFGWITDADGSDLRVFGDGFELADAGGGPLPDPCDDPLVGPDGFEVELMTWAKLFTPRDGAPVPVFPNSNGFPVPIGANKGVISAAMFRMPAGMTATMFADPSQANPREGYYVARPADAMFISISQCPGDMRMKPGFDPCAKFTNTGSLSFNTVLAGPHPFSCTLQPDTDYFINVTPHNPFTLEHSCRPVPSSADGCDVQARQTSP